MKASDVGVRLNQCRVGLGDSNGQSVSFIGELMTRSDSFSTFTLESTDFVGHSFDHTKIVGFRFGHDVNKLEDVIIIGAMIGVTWAMTWANNWGHLGHLWLRLWLLSSVSGRCPQWPISGFSPDPLSDNFTTINKPGKSPG